MPTTLAPSKSRVSPGLCGLFAASSLLLSSCSVITAISTPIPQEEPAPSGEPLQFDITEGRIENHFYRQGAVAAHLLATSGKAPRLIFAFPAGNTGVGVWFKELDQEAELGVVAGTKVESAERADKMRGVSAHLRSSAQALSVHSAVLANIRTLRDYIYHELTMLPPEVAHEVEPGPPVVLRRTTVDGQHHVELRLTPEEGTTISVKDGQIELTAGESGEIRLLATALADDPPLTPFAIADLLTDAAADRPRDKQALAFLASEEKFLAGSWRFLTYFGRDTLLSLRMLMPVLKPPVIEGALGSVLSRLEADGDVAHEEAIGEFAALENMKLSPKPADVLAPILDYKMVDDDFLLAPVLAAYLLDTPEGQARAREFLARKAPSGERYDDKLRKNLELVAARATPFAMAPGADTLVSIKEGIPVGNWRDSDKGLGGGRRPFDINVALVPAALKAAERLYKSDLLGENADAAAKAAELGSAWTSAETYFRITVPADTAKAQVSTYAASLGLDPAAAVASINSPVLYHGVAIDAAGKPVPVMHTDAGFVMLFTDPSPEYLDAVATHIERPFPAGLRTAVGLVVANAAYGDAAVQGNFTRGDYHGAVVWSWQQALVASGLKRQIARADLPEATRTALKAAEKTLWEVILALKEQSTGELWSWEPKDGKEALLPFGQASGHVDESNAAQLWSTVYLAVQPPAQ